MTLASKAYISIRQDIILGHLAPDTQLRMAELKESYGMGFSPLREALNRLHSEHLVEAIDLKGFKVSSLSTEELQDTNTTRIEIESKALRASIKLGRDDWEARVVAALHSLNMQARRQKASDSIDELEKRHHHFHYVLIDACDSRWKLRFFEQLYHAAERYRIPALLNNSPGANRDIQQEHSKLAEAALDRDSVQACKLLRQHYELTAKWIIENMQAESSRDDCLSG